MFEILARSYVGRMRRERGFEREALDDAQPVPRSIGTRSTTSTTRRRTRSRQPKAPLLDEPTAPRSIAELKAEIDTLTGLKALALGVRQQANDVAPSNVLEEGIRGRPCVFPLGTLMPSARGGPLLQPHGPTSRTKGVHSIRFSAVH